MLILCPNCATSYQVQPEVIGPAGRLVQCTRCATSWFAEGPESGPEIPVSAENVYKPIGWFSPPDANAWKAADAAGAERWRRATSDDQWVEAGELTVEADSIAPPEDPAAQDDVAEPS